MRTRRLLPSVEFPHTFYKWAYLLRTKRSQVCSRWLDFRKFHADMGNPPTNFELGRINPDRPFSKENCEWVTHRELCQRSYGSPVWILDGKKYKSSYEAASSLGVSQSCIIRRCKGYTYTPTGKRYPPVEGCSIQPRKGN